MSKSWAVSSFVHLACVLLLLGLAGGRIFAQQVSGGSSSNASGSGSSSENAPVQHITIAWHKVSGAIHYEVLVRPLGGDVTIDQKTSGTSIAVVLTPGTYQVRVITYNLFDKPASTSPWHILRVVRVFKPAVDRLLPETFYSGVTFQSLTVEGKSFLPETTVELMRGGSVVARGEIDEESDVKLKVHFDLANVPVGSYSLRLGNPENLVLFMKQAIQVRKRIQPRLVSISLAHGYNDRVYHEVEVVGKGFSKATAFFLENGTARIDIPTVVVRSASLAVMNINLAGAISGPYSLVASNPGGLKAQINNAVAVDDIRMPKYVSMTPTTFTIGRGTGDFTLTTKDLIPEAQVFLQKGSALIPTASLADLGPSNRTFRIDLTSVAPGTYDLVIRNSRTLTALVPHLVEIKPRPIPRVTSSSLFRAYNTVAYPKVVLLGQNLEPGYRVVLKRGTVLHDLVTSYVSSRQIDFAVDFRGMPPGNYNVLVQDSGHVVASLPGGITVTTPPQLFVHPTGYRLLVGYPYQLVLSQSFSGSLTSSYAGGNFIAAFPVGVKFFPKAPIVRDMGLGIDVGYSQFVDTKLTSTPKLGVTKMGLDLYYRTPFNFPLNVVFRVGYGVTLTAYSVPNPSGTVTGTSFDYYYDAGLDAEVDVGKWITFDAGALWSRVNYTVANLDTVAFVVRSGVRLGG